MKDDLTHILTVRRICRLIQNSIQLRLLVTRDVLIV